MADKKYIKTFEYKLRPNKTFIAKCEGTMEHCRFLYNCALEGRISNYKQGKSLGYYEQSQQLTEARHELPEVSKCLLAIQRDTLRRLDKAYQAFFRRLKSGDKPGFPRFKGSDRWHSFGQQIHHKAHCLLAGDKLTVPGIGSCRVRLSRPIEGKVKHLIITRRASGWYALLMCEIPRLEPLTETGLSIGVDVGLTHFATLSNGEKIDNPRCMEDASQRLTQAQRSLSRKKQGSANRRKARQVVARLHERVANTRKDFHHKVARDLVSRFDTIAVENLNVRGMVKNHHLAKAISDVAWSAFFLIIAAKAEWAGRRFEKVNPRYTSMTCSVCAHVQKMPLAVRVFDCAECHNSMCRDQNAAINILGRVAPTVEGDSTLRSRNRPISLASNTMLRANLSA